MRPNITSTIIFFVYLIFGLYFLNVPFNFVELPAINDWIIFVGGILLIFGGIKYLRSTGLGLRHY